MKKCFLCGIALLLAVVLLNSCGDDGGSAADSRRVIRITAGVEGNAISPKLVFDGTETKWETTDCIGVSSSDVNNVRYKAQSEGTTSEFCALGSAVTTDGITQSTYTAYYPFRGEEGLKMTDPVTIDVDNTIDYMFASQTTNSDDVHFLFRHLLSRLTVLITSDGINEISASEWQVTKGLRGGSILQQSGNVSTEVSPSDMPEYKGSGSSVLVPEQTINSGLLRVRANGNDYTLSLVGYAIKLNPGKHVILTLVTDGDQLKIQAISPETPHAPDMYQGSSYSGHEWVILEEGGIKWSTMNLGAAVSAGEGDYYAWGATYGYMYDPATNYGSDNEWTSTNPFGYKKGTWATSDKYRLDKLNDAASILWGGTWRIPTREELSYIFYMLDNKTNNSGWDARKKGINIIGSTGKSIFLPAVGRWENGVLQNAGRNGCYWSSSPYKEDALNSLFLDFSEGDQLLNTGDRRFGLSIRPVSD